MRGFLKGIGIVLAGAVFLAAAATVAFPQSAITLVYGIVQNRVTVNVPITISVANTFQTALAALTSGQRQSLSIQNNNTNTDNCWVFVGAGSATKATAILLTPGLAYTRYWPYVPSDPIQVTCAGTDSMYLDYQ